MLNSALEKNNNFTRLDEGDAVNWTWTWTGRFFGYWDGNDLWTYHGKHVGRRHGLEIYAPNGRYLGETLGNKRLAVNKAKVALLRTSFVPLTPREAQLTQPDLDYFPPYTGFEDFRLPDQF